MVEVRLRRGKADYVTRRLSSGDLEIVCLCKHNADLSIRGCISQVPGEYTQDVVNNNGLYSSDLRKILRDKNNGKLPDLKCGYCYARRHNYGRVTPAEIGKKTIKDFEILKPEFVRLGKNNEAGHIFYRPTLIRFLELCREFETRVIFPTKMLEFDERVAKLLEETDSTLLYSLGWDKLEPGACSQGFTNEWRIQQAEEYALEGVNTSLTMVCDITSSIGENVDRGNAIGLALDWGRGNFKKRILPIRPNSRKVAQATLGIHWDDAKYVAPIPDDGHANLFPEEYIQSLKQDADKVRYFLKKGGDLIPRFFHPDFSWFQNELAVCGRVGDLEYCDKCNASIVRNVFPASTLVRVKYPDEKRVSRKKYRAKKRKQRGQFELSFG